MNKRRMRLLISAIANPNNLFCHSSHKLCIAGWANKLWPDESRWLLGQALEEILGINRADAMDLTYGKTIRSEPTREQCVATLTHYYHNGTVHWNPQPGLWVPAKANLWDHILYRCGRA